jgi:hypothetical protein
VAAAPLVPDEDRLRELELAVQELRSAPPGRRPWYRQFGTVLALLAFALSLATTALAEQRNRALDAREERTRFHQLMVQVSDTLDQLGQRYTESGPAATVAVTAARARLIALSGQAAELADRMPSEVSAAENYDIGTALANSDAAHGRTVTFYRRGLAKARDFTIYVEIAQNLGAVDYQAGDYAGGRGAFEAANGALTRFPGIPPVTLDREHAKTEFLWAYQEAKRGDCQQARAHLSQAKSVWARVPGATLASVQDSYVGPIEARC